MGKRKAEQIRATGAEIVVSPCANCKKQLKEVCEDNGLADVRVAGLHDLLLEVIDFGVPRPRKADEVAPGAPRATQENEASAEPEAVGVALATRQEG